MNALRKQAVFSKSAKVEPHWSVLKDMLRLVSLILRLPGALGLIDILMRCRYQAQLSFLSSKFPQDVSLAPLELCSGLC